MKLLLRNLQVPLSSSRSTFQVERQMAANKKRVASCITPQNSPSVREKTKLVKHALCETTNKTPSKTVIIEKADYYLRSPKIRCTNKENCSWRGRKDELQVVQIPNSKIILQTHLNKCDFELVRCRFDCGINVLRKDILSHQKKCAGIVCWASYKNSLVNHFQRYN